jgi:hypothetical protein
MLNEQAMSLIEQRGCLHGDHYSFNTQEFVVWSQEMGETMSQDEATHLLQQFCQPMGMDRSEAIWRHYIR